MPTVLLVSGGCHVPAHFQPLQGVLEGYGYEVVNPALPANSLFPPKNVFEHDKNLTRGIAEGLANQGKEVIVLMHSYGGFLGTEAMAGLGIKDRKAQGLPGGVRWMAYMAALIPVIGETFMDTLQLAGPLGNGTLDQVYANELNTYPKFPGPKFYHDLPQEAQDHWTSLITGHASELKKEKVTKEAWRNIDTSFMYCSEDRALLPENQKMMVDRIRGMGITVKEVTVNSSHSPFLSRTQDVLKWINELAGIGEWNEKLG